MNSFHEKTITEAVTLGGIGLGSIDEIKALGLVYKMLITSDKSPNDTLVSEFVKDGKFISDSDELFKIIVGKEVSELKSNAAALTDAEEGVIAGKMQDALSRVTDLSAEAKELEDSLVTKLKERDIALNDISTKDVSVFDLVKVEEKTSFRLFSSKPVSGGVEFTFIQSQPSVVFGEYAGDPYRLDLGYFSAKLTVLNNGSIGSYIDNCKPRVYALYGALCAAWRQGANGKDYCHHIHVHGGGEICFGKQNDRAIRARTKGDVAEYLACVDGVLRNFNEDFNHYGSIPDMVKASKEGKRAYYATKEQCEFISKKHVENTIADMIPTKLTKQDGMYDIASDFRKIYPSLVPPLERSTTTDIDIFSVKDGKEKSILVFGGHMVEDNSFILTKGKIFKDASGKIHIGNTTIKYCKPEDIVKPIEIKDDTSGLMWFDGGVVLYKDGKPTISISAGAEDDNISINMGDMPHLAGLSLYDVLLTDTSGGCPIDGICHITKVLKTSITIAIEDDEIDAKYKLLTISDDGKIKESTATKVVNRITWRK